MRHRRVSIGKGTCAPLVVVRAPASYLRLAMIVTATTSESATRAPSAPSQLIPVLCRSWST